MSGKGIRGALKVSGSAAPLARDAALAGATDNYQRYVQSQTDALLDKTEEFVAAVKAGDVAKAKALYPVARTYWERIEPVAEIFGDLDPKIDGREDVVEEGMEFTGFHRIEKDLWTTGDISKDGADRRPAAGRRQGDRGQGQRREAHPAPAGQRRQGAARRGRQRQDHRRGGPLLAHRPVGLQRQRGGLEGRHRRAAPRAGAALAGAGRRSSTPSSPPSTTALGKHRAGDGWKLHNQLTKAELKELSDAINALAEPISKVAAVVAQ